MVVLSLRAGSAFRRSFSTRSILSSCAPIPSRRSRTTDNCSYKFIEKRGAGPHHAQHGREGTPPSFHNENTFAKLPLLFLRETVQRPLGSLHAMVAYLSAHVHVCIVLLAISALPHPPEA